MTRINVVPVEELTDQHLRGEYKEITRVFSLVRKAVAAGQTPGTVGIPDSYRMGAGHVKFFYDKLGYVSRRYASLAGEMRSRGMAPNITLNKAIQHAASVDIPCAWWNSYTPTPDALRINRERISERLAAA